MLLNIENFSAEIFVLLFLASWGRMVGPKVKRWAQTKMVGPLGLSTLSINQSIN